MKRASGLTAIALTGVLVAASILLWPVRASIDGRIVGCGSAAPWVVHVGYDPRGPDDPEGTYDEFLACRGAAVPRALLGWATVVASGALLATSFVRRPGQGHQ